MSASVTLAWDPNPEPDIVGYRIYRGTVSRAYDRVVSVGTGTSQVLSDLVDGTSYVFAVTAVNAAGLESDFSNEVDYTVPVMNPGVPTVVLTSPSNGVTFTSPATVPLQASVNANGQVISRVRFFLEATRVGEDLTAPYEATLTGLAPGTYRIQARALYGGNLVARSEYISVQVVPPPPVVALDVPIPTGGYIAPATLELNATVADNGNVIQSVQFFDGVSLLGEVAFSPYRWSFPHAAAGDHPLMARVLYGAGQRVDSPVVWVSVSGLPAPWETADIGFTEPPGEARAVEGQFRLNGSGPVAGLNDRFRFVYQPLDGDGEIVARVDALSPHAGAVAGVMIRESLAENSTYVFMGVESEGVFRFQRRTSTAADTVWRRGILAPWGQSWVRVQREGTKLTALRSVDRVNWTQTGSFTVSVAGNTLVGLVVASGNSDLRSEAVLGDVHVIP